jgi:drug/metabolite transporter (DMT)-like permease
LAIGSRVGPLSVAVAGYITLGNQAYLYCSVPFLQMCKQLNPVLVYCVSLLVRIEGWDSYTAALLVVVTMGCLFAINAEINFSALGAAFQLGGQSCNVLKVVAQQHLMQGSRYKIDPMTMILLNCTFGAVSTSALLYYIWTPEIWIRAQAHWGLLAFNCVISFFLDLTICTVIEGASGVSFIVAGIVKNMVVVVFAMIFFQTQLAPVQWCGYSLAILGTAFYTRHRHARRAARNAAAAAAEPDSKAKQLVP